jgi:hypothetical protein
MKKKAQPRNRLGQFVKRPKRKKSSSAAPKSAPRGGKTSKKTPTATTAGTRKKRGGSPLLRKSFPKGMKVKRRKPFTPRQKKEAVRIKRLLQRQGKIISHELVSEYFPLGGGLRALWLDGHYRSVLAYVKANKRTPGRVVSIRAVMAHYLPDGKRGPDVVQRRALKAGMAEWETYLRHTEGFGDAKIVGFELRIVTKRKNVKNQKTKSKRKKRK